MQTDLRGQNHKEKKSGGEVKRSLRFVGTAAAVLVVLGLVLGLQQICKAGVFTGFFKIKINNENKQTK